MPALATITIDELADLDIDTLGVILLNGSSSHITDRHGESFGLSRPTITVNSNPSLLGDMYPISEHIYRYEHVVSVIRPVSVVIESDQEDVQFRYTLNGKSPSHTSRLYSSALSLTQSAYGFNITLKVRAYREVNGRPSPNEKSPVVIAQIAIRKH